jgi:hypothetical protein
MLDERVRVQSEVATMHLMKDALGELVPAVYGWGPAVDGERGWVLSQKMSGELMNAKFHGLDDDKKRDLLGQLARIFKAIQDYKLPTSAVGYGGLNFDEAGNVVIGPTPIAGGGPCGSFEELYMEYFQTQRAFMDKCDVVRGWEGTDLKERIDEFGSTMLRPLLQSLTLTPRPTLIHADLGG